MSMTIQRPLIATLLAACSTATAVRGATLFTDDFSDKTVGAIITDGLGPGGDRAGSSSADQQVASNSGSPFGASNTYADINDSSNTWGTLRSNTYTELSGAVSTFQFDFHETSTGGSDVLTVGYAESGGTLPDRVRVNLDDGRITGLTTTVSNTYSLNTSYTMYLIFNDTGAAVNYAGGTVAAGTADVWIEDFGGGNATYAGSVNATGSQTASYRVVFRSFSTQTQQVYVDNVTAFTGAAAIPEPSSAFILLGATGGLLLLHRRRAS
ncbi:PEP-CTERM sorting domain-containing protein [Haloferula sp. A504]|uniref:PEP-CTERM sorting domain-containing protein n=1 Tax=Haloferula sp. A504 TaxID=3373601 RepID=UPI0031BD8A23|nr:PEP-CTERM sorting domain-containing protein [Verrucomicrobiaceae bacterium E54]